ncbi:Nonribosomal peptide synthetase 3 [Pyrenophora tritici-repentis]|nr:Nonribosomal peptide synthetase 3 [Pyrenophora tritici-repentis]
MQNFGRVSLGGDEGSRKTMQEDREAASVYWQSTLAGCQAISFPTLPPAVQQPVTEATTTYQCPPLVKRPSDVTISTIVYGAWAIVASYYTNVDDVVFGTTITGRKAHVNGVEAMFEPDTAIVPVRVCIRDNATVSCFLHDLQQQEVQLILHEQTGLEQIAKVSADAKRACHFQTLLVLQPASGKRGKETIGERHSQSKLQEFMKFALVVQCVLDTEGIRITASFDLRVLDQWNVDKMLHQFSFVMLQLAGADEDAKIATIDAVTPEDRQQLWEWNRDIPPTTERCIHDLFTEQARARPTAPAICAWDGEMTYGELDALSSRLAGHLVELGVKPEVIVPLCFEKSMWTVVAMLAVLKAGGAFAPLDPEHPARRHEIFRQTKARVVLASERHTSLCKRDGRAVVTVNKASAYQLLSEASERRVHPNVQPGNAAYIIFTSGSTGSPKGVVMEHQAIATSSLGHGEALGFTQDTRALQFASYTFDACIAEIWTTLIHGGCTCVPSERDRRNSLSEAISRMSATWAILTPTVARLLDRHEISPLSTLALGGEMVRSTDWDIWEGHVRLIHAYGPTECCVFSNACFDVNASRSAVIGKSIASVSWVVNPDDHHRLAPLGSVGELLVEGPILARGYLDDVEKTAAAFICDPAWLLEIGRRGRLYKTGDLVRYNADGDLVYMGRKDGQVKIRGQRVELGEIEHHVREFMPTVEQMAAEVIMPGNKKDKAVVAVFVQQDNVLTEGGLVARAFFPTKVDEQLSERLPNYMVPGVYIELAKLPTTT